MEFMSKCGSALVGAVNKTLTVPGLVKFNKLTLAIYDLSNQVFPLYIPQCMSVYYNQLNKPGQPFLESLSICFALLNSNDKCGMWYGGQGDFKSSIDALKSLFGLGAEACTTYIAEQKINTSGVSVLGWVASGFGSISFFANTNANTVKDIFFCGIAACDFLTIGEGLWTAYSAVQGNSSCWRKIGGVAYNVLADEKKLITLSSNVAKLWLIFFPPTDQAKLRGLILFVNGMGYYKYLRF